MGFIKLDRDIFDDYLWKQSKIKSKFEAWIDMVRLAKYKEVTIPVNGQKVILKRGDLAYSQEKLSKFWGWSRGTVIRFLNELETAQLIIQRKSKLITIISIVNYDVITSDSTTVNTSLSTTVNTTVDTSGSTTTKEREEIKEHKEINNTGLFQDLPKVVKPKEDVYPFEQFWNDYDKKTGKKIVEPMWAKLSDKHKLEIKDHIPKYKKHQPDSDFRKDPERYLKKEAWYDEFTTDVPKSTNGQFNAKTIFSTEGQTKTVL